jgi:Tfp pilus assembly protein PilO
MRFSKREQLVILLAVICAVFYVFYQFLLLPKWGGIDRLRSQVKKMSLDLRVTESKLKILEAAEKRVGELKQTEKPAAILPTSRSLEVLKVLAQTTSKSQLQLVSIKPIVEEGKEGLKFEMICQGNYHQLYSFLTILHNVDLVILLDSLNVTGKNGTRVPLEIKMVLTAHV